MNLTRERKILLAVAVAGVGALAVDRLFVAESSVSGPASARADAVSSVSFSELDAAAGAASGLQSTRESTAGGREPLLHRMRQLPEAGQFETSITRDAFKPPASWLPEKALPEDKQAEPTSAPVDDRAGRFISAHRVTSIMSSPAGDLVLIGGRTYQVGDQIDGFTLVAVESRAAVFRTGEPPEVLEVTLTLPEPGMMLPQKRR